VARAFAFRFLQCTEAGDSVAGHVKGARPRLDVVGESVDVRVIAEHALKVDEFRAAAKQPMSGNALAANAPFAHTSRTTLSHALWTYLFV